MGFCFTVSGALAGEGQVIVSDSVEVIIQGKQYKSIGAYKRQQIKDALRKSLSSFNLKEFSEDELYEIIKDVRKQQTTNSSSTKSLGTDEHNDEGIGDIPQTIGQDREDQKSSQMQEMLNQYHQEHEEVKPLFIDPEKVKSVIIKPPEQPADDPKE